MLAIQHMGHQVNMTSQRRRRYPSLYLKVPEILPHDASYLGHCLKVEGKVVEQKKHVLEAGKCLQNPCHNSLRASHCSRFGTSA